MNRFIWQQFLKRHDLHQRNNISDQLIYVEITRIHEEKEHQVRKWNVYFSFATIAQNNLW